MELTYTLPAGMFEDDFPFPKVGYVSFLEGIIYFYFFLKYVGITPVIYLLRESWGNHLFNEGNRIPTRWAPTSESGAFFSPVTPLFSAIYRGYV